MMELKKIGEKVPNVETNVVLTTYRHTVEVWFAFHLHIGNSNHISEEAALTDLWFSPKQKIRNVDHRMLYARYLTKNRQLADN